MNMNMDMLLDGDISCGNNRICQAHPCQASSRGLHPRVSSDAYWLWPGPEVIGHPRVAPLHQVHVTPAEFQFRINHVAPAEFQFRINHVTPAEFQFRTNRSSNM